MCVLYSHPSHSHVHVHDFLHTNKSRKREGGGGGGGDLTSCIGDIPSFCILVKTIGSHVDSSLALQNVHLYIHDYLHVQYVLHTMESVFIAQGTDRGVYWTGDYSICSSATHEFNTHCGKPQILFMDTPCTLYNKKVWHTHTYVHSYTIRSSLDPKPDVYTVYTCTYSSLKWGHRALFWNGAVFCYDLSQCVFLREHMTLTQ